MSVLCLAGQRFNLLENATTVTLSTAADSLFPATNLYDRNPASIFKFGSLTSDPTITFDLDQLGDTGGFETASGFPVGWTEVNTGTSDVTRDTIIFDTGAASAKFTSSGGGGAGIASAIKDITMRSNQRAHLYWALAGDAGLGRQEIRVRNQQTGYFLVDNSLPATVWDAGDNELDFVTGDTFQSENGVFQVQDFTACGGATTTVRIELQNANNGTVGQADSLHMDPAVNFCSIHGHNIDTRNTVTVESSDDNSAWTVRGTFTVRKPSMYVSFSTIYARYWRVKFTGTNSTASGPIWIGELVLGDAQTLSTGPLYPMSVGYRDYQIRVPMRWGDQAYGLGQAFTRSLPLNLQATSMTNRLEILEVFERSRGGHPLVIVPHNADSHTDVIYGRLATDLPHDWLTRSIAKITTSVEELPFPFVTS